MTREVVTERLAIMWTMIPAPLVVPVNSRVDVVQKRRLPKGLMTDLSIIAATSTDRHWWRGCTLAARWRD